MACVPPAGFTASGLADGAARARRLPVVCRSLGDAVGTLEAGDDAAVQAALGVLGLARHPGVVDALGHRLAEVVGDHHVQVASLVHRRRPRVPPDLHPLDAGPVEIGEQVLDATGRQQTDERRRQRTAPVVDHVVVAAQHVLAQFDEPGNRTGFNNGFDEIRLDEPVTFPGDTTQYWYRFDTGDLLAGWQYLFTVTAFDEGDPEAGLTSFESSRTANAARIFPGTPPADDDRKVGVYPNPYRVSAAWDGGTARTRKLNFFNLPPRAEVRIYTLAGEIVKSFDHDADTYAGDIRWYDNFSAENRRLPGGEHSWDILSENELNLSGGLYLFTVRDLDSGETQQGKFVIIK